MILFLQLTFKQLHTFFTNKEQRLFMWFVLRYSGRKRFLPLHIKFSGKQFHVPDARSFVWQYKEIFADKSYAFPAGQKPVILDCGANVGAAAVFFKQCFPDAKIRAYEADPQVAAFLKENLENNACADVELCNKAVWINEAGIEIGQEGADGGGIFAEGKRIKVPSVRLADELRQFEQVDMLKMDIEGAETRVIKDAETELKRVKNFFIEYHAYVGQPHDLGEILGVLERTGFRYFIKPEADRSMPFINRKIRWNPNMDLQLNVFAYRD